MRASLLLVPLLVACEGGIIGQDSGDTGSDTGSDTGTDTADTDTGGDTGSDTASTGCTATVSYQSPRDDETNVSVSKIVTVRFSAAVAADEWALAIDGVTGTAALAANGLSATFTPDAELATNTDYTLRTTVCDATTVTQFRTASGPVDPSILEGRTYAVAYEDITWVQPAGIDMLIGIIGQPFEYTLIHVDDVDEVNETITTTGAEGLTEDVSGDIVQDPCSTPTNFDPADFSGNPVVEVGPADLAFDAGGTPIVVQGAYMKSVVIEDGAALGGIDISGQLDTATMSLGLDVCSLGSFVGLTCVACYSNPSSPTCIDVRLTADRAEWVDGLVFDPALDPTQNSACN